MNRKQDIIIRNIENLGLGSKAKELAYQLINKIDMPVVFWINSTCDKNYSNRLPYKHNQYWVTVMPQKEQSEFDRLILAGLCRGIQNRKRYPTVKPNDYYSKTINSNKSKQYFEFINHLYSFVSTIIIEAFLTKHGIVTSKTVREEQFKLLINRINITISKYSKGKRLITDFGYCNIIIDLGNFFRLGTEYKNEITKIVNKVKPKKDSNLLLQHIRSFSYIIEETLNKCDINNGAECSIYLMQETIKQFALQKYVEIEYQYAMANAQNKIYSFIPEGINNEQLYIDCFKYSNTCIVIFQDYYEGFHKKKIPDPQICIKFCNDTIAYANGNSENYFITFTDALFDELLSNVNSLDIKGFPEEISNMATKENILRTILKYCIFYITLHEMAHILNGDCENPNHQNKEQRADDFSKKLIRMITTGQYRPEHNDPTINFLNFQKDFIFDDYAIEKAYSIVFGFRDNI